MDMVRKLVSCMIVTLSISALKTKLDISVEKGKLAAAREQEKVDEQDFLSIQMRPISLPTLLFFIQKWMRSAPPKPNCVKKNAPKEKSRQKAVSALDLFCSW